jgi:hypothetical protein
VVEKQYRNRLNAQFEMLLAALPTPVDANDVEDGCDMDEERKISKVEVLEMARRRIRSLERETDCLRREREELETHLGRSKDGRGHIKNDSGFCED